MFQYLQVTVLFSLCSYSWVVVDYKMSYNYFIYRFILYTSKILLTQKDELSSLHTRIPTINLFISSLKKKKQVNIKIYGKSSNFYL